MEKAEQKCSAMDLAETDFLAFRTLASLLS